VPGVSDVTVKASLKSGGPGYDRCTMGLDALLPPPLSRAHHEAQADEVQAMRERVDDFLSRLDDELPAPRRIRSHRTRTHTANA
jgi:hypothetical protein